MGVHPNSIYGKSMLELDEFEDPEVIGKPEEPATPDGLKRLNGRAVMGNGAVDGVAVFAALEVTTEDIIAFEEDACDEPNGEKSDGAVSVSKEMLDISDKLAEVETADEAL